MHIFVRNVTIVLGDIMKRKVYEALLEWKINNTNQSLLVKGTRQIGKTYIIKEFGKKEFRNLVYINFEDRKDLRDIFENMPNSEEAVKTLQAIAIAQGVFNTEDDTLIFLDEIQLSKRAYSLLKPLTEMNRFRIIASGSLLGIQLGDSSLHPGPTVKHIDMYPMDFEEFLWAKYGTEFKKTINDIKKDAKNGKLINEILHALLNNDIKEYIIVGGMPKVVQSFIDNRDLGEVFIHQNEILHLYQSDIQQYQSSEDKKLKTLQCFKSIPRQLSKENHRFQYSVIEKGSSGRRYDSAILWLEQSGIAQTCNRIDHLKGTLVHGIGNGFKLYMNDIGLLVCMMGKDYVYKILHDQLGMFKGALWEQLLSQMLTVKTVPLYYITPGRYEIDFLMEYNGNIYPIECKSGGNTKSKSLRSYIDKYHPHKAFKISMNNINIQDDRIKAIPHYLFALLTIDEIMNL